jgi:hypothetical protein
MRLEVLMAGNQDPISSKHEGTAIVDRSIKECSGGPSEVLRRPEVDYYLSEQLVIGRLS